MQEIVEQIKAFTIADFAGLLDKPFKVLNYKDMYLTTSGCDTEEFLPSGFCLFVGLPLNVSVTLGRKYLELHTELNTLEVECEDVNAFLPFHNDRSHTLQ